MISSILQVLLVSVSLLQGTLTGKVTDQNGAAVPGVSVHLLNTHAGAITDAGGQFALPVVPPGKYVAQISAVGYATQEQTVIIGDDPVTLDVTLRESTTQLDAVVVTAEKKEEDQLKVPYTVNAISARQVEQYRLWNSKDITAIIPNLYSANPCDNRNVTSIRGVTTTSYDPAVATYIDGVNQFGLDTYIAQLFDIERIEVLSGPQGTLYGRNAMGGVINIISKQPTNQLKGFAEATVGNYGQQRYSFGVRTPLVKNKLYLGVAGLYDANTGFYTNTFDNSEFDKKHSYTGNYFLRYNVNSQWAITLNAKHNANRNNGSFALAGTPAEAFEHPFEVNQNAKTTLIDNTFNTSLVANYAGHNFNFTSQTAYQSNNRYYDQPIDSDFSPADVLTTINNYGKPWNKVKVFTQELKIASPAASSSALKWTAGAYFFSQDNPVKQTSHFGEFGPFFGMPPFTSITNTNEGTSTGGAIYGQATYSFFDKLDITAGLRYDREHKDQSLKAEMFADGVDDPIMVLQPDTSATANFSAVTGTGRIAYRANDQHTIYALYSRGFRAGGFTTAAGNPATPPLHPFDPEFSNNIEAGVKNMFWDNRVSLNVSLFFVQVNNVQVPTLVLPDAITITRNAGTMESKGFDAHLAATPIKGLQVEYNFGLTDAKYTNLKMAVQDQTTGEYNEVDMTNNKQIFTPRTTSMAAVQYTLGLGTVKVMARGEWMALGEQYFDLANTIRQDAYSLFNVRAGVSFTTGGHNFELTGWGRNLGDKQYIAYAYDFGGTHLGDPRNYGATLRYSF